MSDLCAAAPPACPWWCTNTHGDEWQAGGGQLTKHCHRAVLGPDDVDGQPVEIELGQRASLEEGAVIVGEPEVRLFASAALDVNATRTLVETLGRLADMTEEQGIAAA